MPKTPNKSPEETAEDALIGALLKVGMTGVGNRLTWESFHQSGLSAAYRAAHSLYTAGHPATPQAIAVEAANLGLIPVDAPTLSMLSSMSEAVSERDVERLSAAVVKFSQLRNIVSACKEAAAQAKTYKYTPEAIADALQGKITSAAAAESNTRDARDVCWQAAEESLQRMEAKSLPGYQLSIPDFDRHLIRWLPGKNYIIAGRPGMGKTSFALGEAIYATRYGVVLFCSAEMPAMELAQRELAYRTGVPFDEILTGQLTGGNASKVIGCADQIVPGRMYVQDVVLGLAGIRSHARRLKAKCQVQGVPFIGVILDYLQLVAAYGHSREQAVAELSGGMKTLAKELECTCMVLSQLSREGVKGEDKRPQMHHLRDSGAIEQDADAIIFVHRESEYDKNAPPDEAELIIAKNRAGKRGTVECSWSGKHTRFYK